MLYYFWGTDSFAIEQSIVHMASVLSNRSFERMTYRSAQDLLDALLAVNSYTLDGNLPLVWIRSVRWLGERTDLIKLRSQLQAIASDSEAMLFLSSESLPDGRTQFGKWIKQSAQVREFTLIPLWNKADLLQWIRAESRRLGLMLTEPLVKALSNQVGNRSDELQQACEKLNLYRSSGQSITVEVIGQLVFNSSQTSIQFVEAMLHQQTQEGLVILDQLIEANQHPLAILRTASTQVKTWLWVKLMLEAGITDNTKIAQAVGILNPGRVYYLKQEVQRQTKDKLRMILQQILQVEWDIKRGSNPREALQSLLFDVL